MSSSVLSLFLWLSLALAPASASCDCASEIEAMRKDLDELRSIVHHSRQQETLAAPAKGTEMLGESPEVSSTTAAAHPQRRTSVGPDGASLEFSRGSSSIQFDAAQSSDVTKLQFLYQGAEQCWIERVHSNGAMSFGVQGEERFTLTQDGNANFQGNAIFKGKVAAGASGVGSIENPAREFELYVPKGIAFGSGYTYPMVRTDGIGNLELIANAYAAYTNSVHHVTIKSGTPGGGGPQDIAKFAFGEGMTLFPRGSGKYQVTPIARTNVALDGSWNDWYSPARGESGYILIGNINYTGGEYRYVAQLWFSTAESNAAPAIGLSVLLEEKIGSHMLDFRANDGKVQIRNTYGYTCLTAGVVHSVKPY